MMRAYNFEIPDYPESNGLNFNLVLVQAWRRRFYTSPPSDPEAEEASTQAQNLPQALAQEVKKSCTDPTLISVSCLDSGSDVLRLGTNDRYDECSFGYVGTVLLIRK